MTWIIVFFVYDLLVSPTIHFFHSIENVQGRSNGKIFGVAKSRGSKLWGGQPPQMIKIFFVYSQNYEFSKNIGVAAATPATSGTMPLPLI